MSIFRQYEKRSGEVFPEKYKVASLVQIMPKTQATDLKWRFANGLQNYAAMVCQIEQYGQFHRHESAYGRGEADDRMVDALAHEDWLNQSSGAEVAAFYEGISAGMQSDSQEPVEHGNADDEPCDALFRKGKGKGKGKRGKNNNQPAWKPPAGGRDRGKGGKKDEFCEWCLINGHLEKDCRNKAAGKPKRLRDASGRPMRSLEHCQTAMEKLQALQAQAGEQGWVAAPDRGVGSIDRECGPLGLELSAEEFAQPDYVPEFETETDFSSPSLDAAFARGTSHSQGLVPFISDY